MSYTSVSPEQFSLSLLKQHEVVRVKSVYSPMHVQRILSGMTALRATAGHKTKHYIGKTVFNVGFTYAYANENDEFDLYWKRAKQYNPQFTKHLGWYEDHLIGYVSRALDTPFTLMEDYSKPVFNVFTGAHISDPDAGYHVDTDNLDEETRYFDRYFPFTVVTFLSMPPTKGQLTFRLKDGAEIIPQFQNGDLAVFDSRTFHNIEGFAKDFERVTSVVLFLRDSQGPSYYWS